MAGRYLAETHVPAELGGRLFMLGVLPGVHEHDRHCVDAVCARRLQSGDRRLEVEQFLYRAVGADALLHLHDLLVELLGQDDLLGEDIGPRLIGDPERVAKALGDQKQHSVALALQQRVGGHRGAHLHLADQVRGDRRVRTDAQQVANSLQRRVGIGLGIVRKQLAGMEFPCRVAADDVGEGAAAVDPEIPLPGHRHLPLDICAEGWHTADQRQNVNVLSIIRLRGASDG